MAREFFKQNRQNLLDFAEQIKVPIKVIMNYTSPEGPLLRREDIISLLKELYLHITIRKIDIAGWEDKAQQNVFTPELYGKLRHNYYKSCAKYFIEEGYLDYTKREDLPMCVVWFISAQLHGKEMSQIWEDRLKRHATETGLDKQTLIQDAIQRYNKYKCIYRKSWKGDGVVFIDRL